MCDKLSKILSRYYSLQNIIARMIVELINARALLSGDSCKLKKKKMYYFKDKGIDGIDHWTAINTGADGSRTEFIYNLDDVVPASQGHAGIRYSLLSSMVDYWTVFYWKQNARASHV